MTTASVRLDELPRESRSRNKNATYQLIRGRARVLRPVSTRRSADCATTTDETEVAQPHRRLQSPWTEPCFHERHDAAINRRSHGRAGVERRHRVCAVRPPPRLAALLRRNRPRHHVRSPTRLVGSIHIRRWRPGRGLSIAIVAVLVLAAV